MDAGCPSCGSPETETMEHYTMECPAWSEQRDKHLYMFKDNESVPAVDLMLEAFGLAPWTSCSLDFVFEMSWQERSIASHWDDALAEFDGLDDDLSPSIVSQESEAPSNLKLPASALALRARWVTASDGARDRMLWLVQRVPILRFIASTTRPRWAALGSACSAHDLIRNALGSNALRHVDALESLAPRLVSARRHDSLASLPVTGPRGLAHNPDPTSQSPSWVRPPLSSARSGVDP